MCAPIVGNPSYHYWQPVHGTDMLKNHDLWSFIKILLTLLLLLNFTEQWENLSLFQDEYFLAEHGFSTQSRDTELRGWEGGR